LSRRRDRESRHEERLREEKRAGEERRQQLIKLGSAAAFLAVVGVAVLIVLSSGSGGGDAGDIQETAAVRRLLDGIPQRGMVLGDGTAKAKLLEFGDLQCPVCKSYSEEVLPQIIEKRVRAGEATLDFRNYVILGPESTTAGAAALAAGEQGRGWDFVELFYRNQGQEESGYVSDEFLTAIARAARVPDIARWNHERRGQPLIAQVEATTAEAEQLGFSGTPSFAIEGPNAEGTESIGSAPLQDALESAISEAG
jgi:protein-disulfide isomerase